MSYRKELMTAFGDFREWYEVDSDDPRKAIVHTAEDCSCALLRAKVFSEEPPHPDMRHAAVIPMHVLDKAFREGWVNDDKKWRDWANDSANEHLRTWKGRL